jgi:hypothetical protein
LPHAKQIKNKYLNGLPLSFFLFVLIAHIVE